MSKDSLLSNDEDTSSPDSTRKSNRQQSFNNYRRLDSINLNISRNVSKTNSSGRHNNMIISPQDSLQETFESDSDSSADLDGQKRKKKIKLLPGETREKAIERVKK